MKLGKYLILAGLTAMLTFSACEKKNEPNLEPPNNNEQGGGNENNNPVSLDVPDQDGKNVKGVVYCGDIALKDVVVSDGDEVTKTDENGRYYLKSTKRNGNVFVSIPSGYSMKAGGKWPMFYRKLSKGTSSVEQVNFELVKDDNNDYVIIGLADIHIANVREFKSQFADTFLPDLNKTISSYKIAGKKVYVMLLGDQSHDLYWYDAGGIDLEGSKPYLNKIEADYMFATMGNHDNDPKVADDFLAENRYRAEFGPTHYSYNIGGTHYIMLDNIVYVNNGATSSKLGDRSVEQWITADQIAWLKKDLATVSKSTPIVIGMHAMLWKKPSLSGSAQTSTPKYQIDNGAALYDIIGGYNATVLSGHAHINSRNKSGNVEEYNVGSGAGRLWYSGQSFLGPQHLCGDGSPGGFLVMEMSGKSKYVYYKGTGCEKDYQFRTYDLNCSQITAAKFCPASTDALISTLGEEIDGFNYARTDNMVRINVFGYKENWTVKVTENGKELSVKRIYGYDPLWTITVQCGFLQNRMTDRQAATKNAHIFECKASSATSTLKIEVTDDFNRTYTQTMTRPKQLAKDMK